MSVRKYGNACLGSLGIEPSELPPFLSVLLVQISEAQIQLLSDGWLLQPCMAGDHIKWHSHLENQSGMSQNIKLRVTW